MNTLSALLIISSAVSSTLYDVTINFQADSNSCSGKHAYVNVIDPGNLIGAGTTNFPYDVVSSSQSVSMPAGWYGQFNVLADDTDNSPLPSSTRYVFDFQGDYKDYIIVLDSGDFTGEIDVAAANGQTLQAAGVPADGYVCDTVTTSTTSDAYKISSVMPPPSDLTPVPSYALVFLTYFLHQKRQWEMKTRI